MAAPKSGAAARRGPPMVSPRATAAATAAATPASAPAATPVKSVDGGGAGTGSLTGTGRVLLQSPPLGIAAPTGGRTSVVRGPPMEASPAAASACGAFPTPTVPGPDGGTPLDARDAEAAVSVDDCLTRCTALQTANDALLRALNSATDSVAHYKYTLGWDATALALTANEVAVLEPAASIVAGWAPPPTSDGLLVAPTDLFNDRLSFAVRGLHDVEHLNAAMATVASKYAFLSTPTGDPPRAVAACRTFVRNYATLHDQLTRLWARMQGEPSRLLAIRTRLAELNAGDVLGVAQVLGLAAPPAGSGAGTGCGGAGRSGSDCGGCDGADNTIAAPTTAAGALAAMEAVKEHNVDVLTRIRQRTHVSRYTYALVWDAAKGALVATSTVTAHPVASVMATWCLPPEPWLAPVQDFFNDKLPLPPTELADMFTLNEVMAGVARKYCAFGETPLAQATCATMLSNYKLVEAELGRLAASLADEANARMRADAPLARVNAHLAALMATTGARPGSASRLSGGGGGSDSGCAGGHLDEAAAGGGDGGTGVAATATPPATPLVAAAMAGDVAVVVALLRGGANPTAMDSRTGNTALHAAAGGGHIAVMKQLLAAGALVDALDADGCTPLLVAAAQRQREAVAELVRRGASVAATDAEGQTPLHRAAAHNAGEMVEMLLDAGAGLATVDAAWATPLHYAARHGDASLVRVLLKAGANKEATTRQGERPVHWAAANTAGVGVLDALLAAGAKVAAVDAVGRSVLHHAAAGGTVDTVRRVLALPVSDVLARDATDATPLHWAARAGNIHAALALVEAEAPMETQDKESMTPLLAAACCGHVAVVEALRGVGARGRIDNVDYKYPLAIAASKGDVAAVERLIAAGVQVDGGHPLAAAARAGHADVVRVLLAAGANKEAAGSDSDSPLMAAVSIDAGQRGHFEAAALLLAAGVNRGAKRGGDSPLFAAIRHHNAEAVKLLLAAGVNKDAGDPLTYAASYGDAAIVRLLLDAGANKDAGRPLHAAAESGHAEVVKLLVGAGANTETMDCSARTPLCVAIGHGYPDVVSVLLAAGTNKYPQCYLMSLLHSARAQAAQSRGHAKVVELLVTVTGGNTGSSS